MLACAALAGFAAPAAAQTEQTLVSNLGQTSNGSVGSGSTQFGVAFSTGPNAEGYTLNSVDMDIRAGTGSEVTLQIWSATNANRPNAREYTLVNPSTGELDGVETFTAPANTVLKASTRYFLLFNRASASIDFEFNGTDSDSETSDYSWIIGDSFIYLTTVASAPWQFLPRTPRFAIKGVEGAATVTNSPATGTVTIGDTTPHFGESLTVAVSDVVDSDGVPATPAYSYQWIRVDGSNETAISGATASAYTPVAADVGKKLKAQVQFPDNASNTETLTSAETEVVRQTVTVTVTVTPATINEGASPPTATVRVKAVTQAAAAPTAPVTFTLSTNAQNGTATSRVDFDPITQFLQIPVAAFVLLADGTAFEAEATYTLTILNDDVDEESETLEIRAEKDSFTPAWVTLPGAVTVTIDDDDTVPGAPTNLDATAGDTKVTLSWAAPTAPGTSSVTRYDYRQSSDGGSTWGSWTDAGNVLEKAIAGLTNGTEYTFEVRAVSAAGDGAAASVAETPAAAVAGDNKPATGGTVTIGGTTAVGKTLSASVSVADIMDADGLPDGDNDGTAGEADDFTFTYQWIRVDGGTGTDIDGATGSSYLLVAADAGKTVKVRVGFTDGAGNAETLESAATGTIGDGKPGQLSLFSVQSVGDKKISLNMATPSNTGSSSIIRFEFRYKAGDAAFGEWKHHTSWHFPAPVDVTGLTNGVEYTFEARAVNSQGGGPARTVTATPVGLPEEITDLTATANVAAGQVVLRWTAPADGGSAITKYQYRQRTRSGTFGTWTDIALSDVTSGSGAESAVRSYTVTGLTNPRNYTFQARGVNANGDGDDSNRASAATAPDAPRLTLTPGDRQVKVVIAEPVDPNDGGRGVTHLRYRYKESTGASFGAWVSKDVPAGSNSVTVTVGSLANGTEYAFQASAYNDIGGWGQVSAIATATPRTVPSAPVLTATAVGERQIDLRWSAPDDGGADISGYELEVSSDYSADGNDGNDTWTALGGALADSAESYMHDQLAPGTSNHYRLRALNEAGPGAWSAVASATTMADNAAPTFTSSATASVAENTTAVLTVVATDGDTADSVTGYALTGGADRSKFALNGSSGALTFTTAPDFENPTDVGTTNAYVVIVQATSGAGDRALTAEQTITVTVTDADTEAPGKPAAPTVSAVTGSTTRLSVSWTAPSNTGPPIDDYDVRWRVKTPQGSWTELADATDSTATTASIASLTASTDYEVQVRAQSPEGTSDWSASGEGTTSAADNAAPTFTSPNAVDVEENTTTVLTVVATDGDTDDSVTGYAIQGGADASKFEIDATSGALTFATAPDYENPTDTERRNTYVVIVRATSGTASRETTAEQTITVTVTDDDTEAPGAPGAPTFGTATASSLVVNWSAPANAGPAITDYDVRWRVKGSGATWTELADTTDSTARTAAIAGLAASTEYEVQVRAQNAEGTGGWSASGDRTTDAAAVIPPVGMPVAACVGAQWSATMTVGGESSGSYFGFGWPITSGGSLTADSFSYGGTDYKVEALWFRVTGTPEYRLALSGALPSNERTDFTLHVGSVSLALADAELQDNGKTFGWADDSHRDSFPYDRGATVQVCLTSVAASTNAAPTFTSSATAEVEENTTAVLTVVATDGDAEDGITGYTLTGGADISKFAIDGSSGALAFATAPDFENPTDAEPYNSYVVIVQATGGAGDRALTATQTIAVTVTDDDTEAPGAPDAPTFPSATANSLTANWSSPTNAGPAITDYDVRWRVTTPQGSWTELADTTDSTATTASIASLTASTDYEVQVRAQSPEGTSDWSASGEGTTSAADNAAPTFTSPNAVDVEENTTAVLTVVATDGDTADSVTGYAIQGGADASKFAIDGSSGALTFATAPDYENPTDTERRNTYVVIVRATSGTASRETTAEQTITVTVTDDDTEAPGAPAAPTFGTATASSLVVNWSAPANAGPAITDYDVRWRVKGSGATWTELADTTDSTARTAAIAGLAASTEYEVQVRAENAEGDSPWSASGDRTTDAAAVIPPVVTPVAACVGAQWSATMTVGGESSGSFFGFGWPITGGGSLTADSFSYGGTDYKVEALWFRVTGTPEYRLALSGALPSNERTDFTLHVGSVSLALADAELQDNGKTFGWADDSHRDSFPYDRGATVQVCLTSVAASTNTAPSFTEGDTATRRVAENTAADRNVGAAVAATDGDAGDTLTYSLEGADAGSFDIVASSGQLRTGAALDHETRPSYAVTVKADDGNGGTDSIAVTIGVTDVDEQPATPAAPTVDPTAGSTAGLEVNWAAPGRNGGPALTGYEVQYRQGASGTWLDKPHTGTSTNTTVTGLSASTLYQARVRALNGETPSAWSSPGSGRTGSPTNSAPTFPGATATRSVAENTVAGTDIGNAVSATDDDAGDTLTYSLEGADAGSFDIVANSGQLRTRAALDYETKDMYPVTVRVRDDSGATDSITVTINVTDVAEPPTAPARPTILSATANSLTLSWAPPSNSGPPITDYDVRWRVKTPPGSWTELEDTTDSTVLSATITGLTASETYEVQVRAQNAEGAGAWSELRESRTPTEGNNAPVFTEGDPTTRRVAENTAANRPIGAPVSATDDDAGDTLTYSLEGADADSFDIVASSGQLRTRAALDYEAKSRYAVTVRVSDGDIFNTIAVRIIVTDVDERPRPRPDPNRAPRFTSAASASVAENTVAVLRVRASDADARDSVTGYSLVGGADRAKFTIEAASGALSFLEAPDYERPTDTDVNNVYVVIVRSTSGTGFREKTSSQTITVTVTDEDAEAPGRPAAPMVEASTHGSLSVQWAEPANAGPDISDYDVRYRVKDSGNAWTELDDTTHSTVTTASIADLSAGTAYEAQVRAENAEGAGEWSASGEGTTNAAPVFAEGEAATRSVTENTAAGEPVGAPVTATDADAGDTLTYALEGADAASFAIDASTGRIQTRSALDYETKSRYTLTVTAEDTRGGRAAIAVTVEVTDVDERPAVSIEAGPDRVTEGAAATFTLHRTAGAGAGALTVSVAVGESGDMLEAAAPASVTFPADAAQTTLRVPTRDDAADEPESVVTARVTAEAEAPYRVGSPASASVTVEDNDDMPGLSVADSAASEDAGTMTFAVTLGAPSARTVTVEWMTSDGTATADADYEAASGTLALSPGETAATIAVKVLDDALDEAETETFTVTLANADNATLEAPEGTGTILDDEALPGLSVADAAGREDAGTMTFAVTLGAPSARTVTVDWATSDGTATAGSDYEAASGTLTLSPGETAGTVGVPVLDDGSYEAPTETFTVRLANASNATVLAATATGTIADNEEADEATQAWLSRFGRSVAGNLIEGLNVRFEAPPPAGAQLTVNGQRLDGSRGVAHNAAAVLNLDRYLPLHTAAPGTAAPGGPAAGRSGAVSPAAGPPTAGLPTASPAAGGLAAQYSAATSGAPGLGLPRIRLRDLLRNSAFHYAGQAGQAGAPDAARWSVWGRTAGTGFEGEDAGLSNDGEVLSALLGADYERGRVLAGLALSYSDGSGGVGGADDSARADLQSTLTSVHPYLRLAATDSLSVWGTLGLGEGDMSLVSGGSALGTDVEMRLGAVGLKGALPFSAGGLELSVKSDVFAVRMLTEDGERLDSVRGEASRARLVLAGAGQRALSGGGVLSPSVEVGVRYDAGDAEAGGGVEVGAGLQYSNPRRRLTMAVNARMLVAHEHTGYEEWGLGASVLVRPDASGRGASLKLGSTWGAVASGVEGLWSRRGTGGLARGGTGIGPRPRYEVDFGYGLSARRTLLTPYLGASGGGGGARGYRLGVRTQAASPHARPRLPIDLSVELTYRQTPLGAPDHGIELRFSRAR